MKNRLTLVFLIAFGNVSLSFAQTVEVPTYYVTIGVFAKLDNALHYTEKANKSNFSAQYAINQPRKLYYVYLLETTDRKKAFAFMIKMRAETEYKDAWLFIGKLGEEQVEVVQPIEEKPVEIVPVVKDTVATQTVVVEDVPVVEKPVEKPVVVKPAGKAFFFKLVNAETGNEAIGEVHVQESVKANQYQAFKGNEIVYIKAPINKNGTYTVMTIVPGYQQMKITLPYNEPGGTTGSESEIIIPFELKRAKRGDYIDFNNVRFIRNSSIMTPESQFELDGLVALMKENIKYKIMIHGHSNGKNDRDIIDLGTSQKYFELDPSANKKETTTSKALSEYRANAVKGYLISQGIDAKRIGVKAEGGKIPLYPEQSTLATYNDRVEVEVKKH